MTEPMRFPVRSRDEPFDLNRLADYAAEKLTGEERRIVNRVGLELATAGGVPTTFGAALDRLDQLGPAGRREMVDKARADIGLPTIADAEATARSEAATQHALVSRVAPRITECAHPSCRVAPTKADGLTLREVDRRKWWCEAHEHLAGPEDHLPEPPRYVLTAGLALKPVGAEAERLRAEDEKVQAAHREKVEARRRDAERLDRLEQEYRRTLRPPAGFGG